MTPRQQEARSLRNQGLTQQAIAEIMGIQQSRVSSLLDLNRQLRIGMDKYRKTARGRKMSREQRKRWVRNNPEKARESQRKYYQANRDTLDERTKQWQRDNPDKTAARTAKHYQANRENYQANREKILAWNAIYQKTAAGRVKHNRASREYMARKQAEQKAQQAERKARITKTLAGPFTLSLPCPR